MSTSLAGHGRASRGWWTLVGVIVASFVVCAYGMLRYATDPAWQDTEGYLGHSLYIAEHGGFLGFLRESFAGTFPITERHPLYMLVLAPFASRTVEFFFTAKVIDLIFGVAALATLIWMVSRRYGRGPALIAGALYGMSNSLIIASSHVNHESIFTLCTLWTWWFLTEHRATAGAPSFEAQTPQQTPVDRLAEMPPVQRWAIAGIFLGLAYMTKSPASLLGVSIAVAGFWYARFRFVTNPRIWVLLLTTAIVSTPLLVRNLVGFGTPVYEGVNSNIMWIDNWRDIGSERSVMYYDKYGIMKVEKNGLPTAQDYIQTHGPVEIAKRIVKGLITETTYVAPKALAPALPIPMVLGKAWGFLVLGFALAGWWMRRRSWEASFLFFWSAAFFVFFGWDRMFPEIRYLAPLIPIYIAFAAHALWTLLQKFFEQRTAWKLQAVGVSLAGVALSGSALANGSLTKPLPLVAESPSYSALLKWMNTHIQTGDRVLLGPTSEFYGLIWMVDKPVSIVQTPDATTLAEYRRYLNDRNVRYIVMNPENALTKNPRLADALAPYVGVGKDGSIVEKQPLPGWRAISADASNPRHFIIYESELVARRLKSNLEPGQVLVAKPST
jgi:4-amino-4-deoxy-L-arabinose transferase-like glycosyltransferase